MKKENVFPYIEKLDQGRKLERNQIVNMMFSFYCLNNLEIQKLCKRIFIIINNLSSTRNPINMKHASQHGLHCQSNLFDWIHEIYSKLGFVSETVKVKTQLDRFLLQLIQIRDKNVSYVSQWQKSTSIITHTNSTTLWGKPLLILTQCHLNCSFPLGRVVYKRQYLLCIYITLVYKMALYQGPRIPLN